MFNRLVIFRFVSVLSVSKFANSHLRLGRKHEGRPRISGKFVNLLIDQTRGHPCLYNGNLSFVIFV